MFTLSIFGMVYTFRILIPAPIIGVEILSFGDFSLFDSSVNSGSELLVSESSSQIYSND
jgi:hypothetical protein